jgi:WD40 repeat protein/tRNA A-37 threonylcarbamoyl transferase component Bud32
MSDEELLAEMLTVWRREAERGRDMATTDLCRDRPDLAVELEARIRALRRMDNLNHHEDRTITGTPLDAQARGSPPSGPPGPVVPGYELLGELGRGGMGVVYKARQVKLGRVVALKMILSGMHAGEADLARFRTEAEAIARLQHPNIIQIYEVGEQDGQPFFSLEFCAGGSLEKKLHGTPLPPQEAARLVEVLARAMQAAHEKNVIHRDLKPANVLLAEDGTPKITDFGLARKLDDHGQTASGAIVGTPSYMAPEQAGGKSKEIGPPVDIYALGAILYELLTGRPPFKAASALDTILQVVSDEPAPPTQLNAAAPQDLETICLKALAKEPARRYTTARELAEDLARFAAGMPVLARPVGRLERAWRWRRRNPVVAGLLAAVAMTLLLGTSVATVLAIVARNSAERADQEAASARKAREQAEQDAEEAREARTAADKATRQAELSAQEANTRRREAEANLESARRALASAHITQAHAALERQSVALAQPPKSLVQPRIAASPAAAVERPGDAIARDLLDRCAPQYRSWDWHYLDWLCDRSLVTLGDHRDSVRALAFLDKGNVLATADRSGVVTFWTARTGNRLRSFTLLAGKGATFAFSPDGQWLAVGGTEIALHETGAGKMVRSFKAGPGRIKALSFCADGLYLACSFEDDAVQVWLPGTGKRIRTLPGAGKAVAFNADGSMLAAAFERADIEFTTSRVNLYNVQTGEVQRTLSEVGGPLALSPDGKLLAGIWTQPPVFLRSQGFSEVRVFDMDQGKMLHGLDRQVRTYSSVAFHPDSQLVAAGNADNSIKIWQARTGQPAFRLSGHRGAVHAIAFSPDGQLLASASEDRTVKVWDTSTGAGMQTLTPIGGQVTDVVISPDGRMAAAARAGAAFLWGSQELHQLPGLQGFPGVHGLAFSADSKLLIAGVDQQLVIWDTATRKVVRTHPCAGHVVRLAISRDGARLAALLAAANNIVHSLSIWDVVAGKEVLVVSVPGGPPVGLAFNPDGSRLALGTASGGAQLLDVVTGRTVLTLGMGGGTVQDIAFSPDGRLLAAACLDQVIRVWDLKKEKECFTLVGHTAQVSSVAFTPDGLRLISASGDRTIHRFPIKGEVRSWDTESGQNVLTFEAHKLAVLALALGRDGRRLATASCDGTVRIHGRLNPLP